MPNLKSNVSKPSPFIVGIPSLVLDQETRDVLKRLNPVGVILFKRNCESNEQVAALCSDLAEISSLDRPLIFIDQEGGRVARIRWNDYVAPSSEVIGKIYQKDADKGVEAARLNAFLIASELSVLGITGNCAPVADLCVPGAHDIIGDRSFGGNPEGVGVLCGAAISGFMAGGVWPTIKHAPGHGRAMADSHNELPVVNTSLEVLRTNDFAPFSYNAECPFLMTAHVLYSHIDSENCATQSSKVLQNTIRQEMGMKGLIMADDINMKALEGTSQEKASRALNAGCDLVLQCSGNIAGEASPRLIAELEELIGIAEMSDESMQRLQGLPDLRPADPELIASTQKRMKELLADV